MEEIIMTPAVEMIIVVTEGHHPHIIVDDVVVADVPIQDPAVLVSITNVQTE